MTRWIQVAAAVVLLSGALLHVLGGYSGGTDTSEHALGTDDAYISYRYAQNLVDGHGLVFNPGERVEGFTNLGFVLVCAFLLLFVDGQDLYWAATVFNLACLLALFVLFVRHAEESLGVGRARWAAWLLALYPALWLWTASGMETVLVTVFQIAVWIAVERIDAGGGGREVARLAVVLGLGAVVRADGFVWIAIVGAYLVFRGRIREALRAGLASAAAVVLVFAWRSFYYGDLWPNTFYAKVSDPLPTRWQHGAAQLSELALWNSLLPYLVVLLLGLLRSLSLGKAGLRSGILSADGFPSFFSVCLVVYFIHVGGDHFQERFLLVLLPLGIVACLRYFSHLAGRRLALLASVLVIFQISPLFHDPRFAYQPDRYDCWVTLGRFLAERPGSSLLAVDAAGKIPYYSGLETIDMYGLTDRHIARVEPRGGEAIRLKMDPDYVLARRPDLITAWVTPGLHLAAGLDRERYPRAGYRLTWMLNTSRKSRESNVIEVSGAPESEIVDLVLRGYRYGVLKRAP